MPLAQRLKANEEYWADVLYYAGDSRPEAYAALMQMPAPQFYHLLDAHRRNSKAP